MYRCCSMKKTAKIALLASLFILFACAGNGFLARHNDPSRSDQITVNPEPVAAVSDFQDEIRQIESLIKPIDLIENDNDFMRYRVEGNGKYLFLEGTINGRFPKKLRTIFADYPNIKWVVLTNVPGSMADDANLEGAHWLREKGIQTYIPKGGSVASGGTDLFLAGTKRVLRANSTVGVHSWGAGPGLEGKDFPRDSKEHKLYLDYYLAMEIPTDFYWFTLEAAGADNIHNMTLEEIKKYNLATNILN